MRVLLPSWCADGRARFRPRTWMTRHSLRKGMTCPAAPLSCTWRLPGQRGGLTLRPGVHLPPHLRPRVWEGWQHVGQRVRSQVRGRQGGVRGRLRRRHGPRLLCNSPSVPSRLAGGAQAPQALAAARRGREHHRAVRRGRGAGRGRGARAAGGAVQVHARAGADLRDGWEDVFERVRGALQERDPSLSRALH
jgi:hypothetical protein